MKRHFILVPFGSAGDVLPFLWIGRILQSSGHTVRLIAPPVFEDTARRAGVPFVPVGNPAEYDRIVRDPRLWHPWHGMHLTLEFAGRMSETYLRAIDAQIENAGGQDVVLVGSLLAFAVRIAREKYRLPLATVHLQPAVVLSVHDTPVMRAHSEWFTRLPRWLKRALLALPNPLDLCAGAAVRAACAGAGVPPPRSIMKQWMHSPDAVLCLFPEWFGAPQPDWPRRCRLAGFPLYDIGDGRHLPPEVQRFLEGGTAPVLFTPGSAMAHGREFFAVALEACRRLGARAIFATGHREQLPPDLPATILAVDYVPFSRLLPRTAAIVHHGGIGTLSQALAAGVPQLVMPMAHDQPDNAHRLVRLGVARRLYPRKFTAESVAREIQTLLRNTAVRDACATAAVSVRAARPAGAVLDTLESIQRTPSHP